MAAASVAGLHRTSRFVGAARCLCSARCFVFTGTSFGVARLDGDGKCHDHEGQDEFFHWGSYTRFLWDFKYFSRFFGPSVSGTGANISVVTPVAIVLTNPQRSSATQFRLISPELQCPLLPRRRGRGFTPQLDHFNAIFVLFFREQN